MISLLAAIIVALGTISAVMQVSLAAWKSFEVTSLVQRNAARMDELATVARAGLWVDPSGAPRAPLGEVGPDGRLHLPVALVGSDATPWGGRYAWCPLALPPAPGAPTPTGDAGTAPAGGTGPGYPVTTVTASRLAAPPAPFVVANTGGPPQGIASDGVVGYLVSPSPYQAEAPACADVTLRGGVAVVVPSAGPSGSAIPVDSRGTVLSVAAALTAAASDLQVSVAPATLGDGGGEDPADAMALGDAVRLWRRVLPRSTVMSLAPGRYALSADDADASPGDPTRSLRLVSATPGAALLAPATGQVTLRLGGDATLSGVATDTGLAVSVGPGSRTTLASASLSDLEVDGGTAVVDAMSTVSTASANTGALRLVGAAGSHASVSSLVVGDGDVTVDGLDASPQSYGVTGRGRVSLAGTGTLAGSAAAATPVTATCSSPTADGTVICTATCPDARPHLRSPSCGGAGVSLAGLTAQQGVPGSPDSLTCSFRPWRPAIAREVLTPPAESPGTSTAVDLDPDAPSPAPTATATCALSP